MTRRHQIAWLGAVLTVALASIVHAQRSGDGTSGIAGVVLTTTQPATPIARVLVTVSGPTLAQGRTLITDEQGRFDFRGLPSGAFTVVAARAPYVKTAFGAKRPGRPGTAVTLSAGQRLTDVVLRLTRGAVISGMVRNAVGEPAPGVKMDITPLDMQADPLSAPVLTDDRGIYRAFGLTPGKYLVAAGATEDGSSVLTRFSDEEMDAIVARLQRRSVGVPAATGATVTPGATAATAPSRAADPRPATYGYASIYYPGSPDPDQAQTLALSEGEERAGIDISLQLVPTVAIDGHVSAASGTLPSGTQITITRQPRPGAAFDPLRSSTTSKPPDADGDFRFTGVLPGKYRIVARAAAQTAAPGSTSVLWSLVDLSVGTDNVSGVALRLQPGLRLSGRIAFDAHTLKPPTDPAAVRLRLVEVSGATFVTPLVNSRPDGTFEISGILPGTYGMTSSIAAGWSLRSVVVNEREVLDFPLELGPSGDVSGALVTFSDQQTEISGTLQTAANVPAPDYFIVVFARDRAHWRPASRRVQFTRPSTDGHFAVRDLPAGDYLIAALTDMEPTDLFDASFMEALISAAVPVHLGDGEKKTQDLRIAR